MPGFAQTPPVQPRLANAGQLGWHQNQFPEAFDKNNIGYCQCDVTNENSFDAAFRKCIEKIGEVPDILINAAGILGEEQWDTLYDINLVRKYLFVITHRTISFCFIG